LPRQQGTDKKEGAQLAGVTVKFQFATDAAALQRLQRVFAILLRPTGEEKGRQGAWEGETNKSWSGRQEWQP